MARRTRPQRCMWRCTKIFRWLINIVRWPFRRKFRIYRCEIVKSSKHFLVSAIRAGIIPYRPVTDTSYIFTIACRTSPQRCMRWCTKIIRRAVRVILWPFGSKLRIYGSKVIKRWKQLYVITVRAVCIIRRFIPDLHRIRAMTFLTIP